MLKQEIIEYLKNTTKEELLNDWTFVQNSEQEDTDFKSWTTHLKELSNGVTNKDLFAEEIYNFANNYVAKCLVEEDRFPLLKEVKEETKKYFSDSNATDLLVEYAIKRIDWNYYQIL